MQEEGKITPEEFLQTNFNSYYPTEAEFAKPLTDVDSPVYKSGLRLVSMETKLTPCLDSWIESGMSKGKHYMACKQYLGMVICNHLASRDHFVFILFCLL